VSARFSIACLIVFLFKVQRSTFIFPPAPCAFLSYLFSFDVQRWMFDVRRSFFPLCPAPFFAFHSMFSVGCSMFDVHFFPCALRLSFINTY
jgi:hypothetical protein